MTGDAPCSAAEAVARAKRMIGNGGQYVLGTGDYRPKSIAGRLVDVPWTARNGELGSDCAGFAICYAYKLRRHRPGFAAGRVPREYWDQADIDDDINCNSVIEDALTDQEICEVVRVGIPQPGDLLVFASLRLTLHDGTPFKNIGHVGIVIGNSRVGAGVWNGQARPYHLLDVAQCRGPNGREPAVIQTDGSLWERHDEIWPRPAHRTFVIRMKSPSPSIGLAVH